MIDYSKLSKVELNTHLTEASFNGDVKLVKEIFSTNAVKKCYNTIPKNMILIATQRGNLDIIQYMIESREFLDVISPKFLKYISRQAFKDACTYGQKDIVDYLYNILEFKIKDSFELFEDSISLAIKNGHLHLIDYFFNLPDPSFAYKSLKNSTILFQSEYNNQLHIVKHIFSSLKVQDKIGIHCDNDIIFKTAYQSKLIGVLEYFINDLKIEKTPEIEAYMARFPNPEIEKIFLKNSLQSDLSVNDIKNKKIKL